MLTNTVIQRLIHLHIFDIYMIGLESVILVGLILLVIAISVKLLKTTIAFAIKGGILVGLLIGIVYVADRLEFIDLFSELFVTLF